MSKKHPVVVITGSSGAGTSSAKLAFERIFQREGIRPAIIEGDSFHRYDRKEMEWEVEKASLQGRTLTHFGPEGNLFDDLEKLFDVFAANGTGKQRDYLHTEHEAELHQGNLGTFTDWQPLSPECDLLFYEGLHGALVTEKVNIAKHVDLLIGVVPIINLEWMQKIRFMTRPRLPQWIRQAPRLLE